MKRALPLLALGSILSAPAFAGPAIIGSVYVPTVDVGSQSASPDGVTLEIRAPLNNNFWIGGNLATTLNGDSLTSTLGTIDTELGASLSVNLGAQAELAHHVYAYAYVGYGAAKVLLSSPTVVVSDVDGKSVTWGVGGEFLLGDHLLVDAGYASLFDGDMEDSAGNSTSVSIAGPRVGLGFKF